MALAVHAHASRNTLMESSRSSSSLCNGFLVPRGHKRIHSFVYLFIFRIKHENIVALEDIYESPDHLYLIMQL